MGEQAKVKKSAKKVLCECIEHLRKHGDVYLKKSSDY